MSPLIAAIIGFVLGAAIAWAIASSRRNATGAAGDGGAAVLERELSSAKDENRRLNSALTLAQSSAAAAEAEKKKSEENLAEQRAQLANATVQLKDAFAKAAQDALAMNNQQFLDLASTNFKTLREQAGGDLDARKQSVEQLVSPIREAIEKVRAETKQMEENRLKEAGRIGNELQQLATTHQQLQNATMSLVNALKSPKIRGRWGELALKNLVEMAGMSSHCDFVEQGTLESEEGKSQRPDMIVRLPGGRQVPVDSKVPLAAFMQAMEAVDDDQRAAQFKLHAAHTRDHVKRLSEKSYWANLQDAEFVVMFIPNDTFLAVAAEQDPEIIQFGIERRVLIATPSTLMALLKAFSYGWRQATFTENAKQVQALASELLDRIMTFTEYFTKVGDGLSGAVDSYNKALKSWQSRLLPHADKLKELGAGGVKELPEMEQIDITPLTLKQKNSKTN